MSTQPFSQQDFELISLSVGVYFLRVGDENVKIRVWVIPIQLFKRGDNDYGTLLNVVISTYTDKPKYGEQCTPAKMMNHQGVVPTEIKGLSKAEVKIRANDGKVIKISLEITNLVIYPDLRDLSGSPCVFMSWITFQSVE